ncbi:Phospholipid-transporting ATPase DNF1 [Colletotrichum sp. SAR 10_75]|nr:Phospholipid-transporting ATPase DNF1 [Colletotrichum sp. SAR 10_75]
MASVNGEAGPPPPDPENPTLRTRWATRKMTIKSSSKKRLSLMNRAHHKKKNSEKSRSSGGGDSLQTDHTAAEQDDGHGGRKLFFNLPLPPELKDEEGHPSQHFTRNKIRTAKYTPLSFVPKNLWFQFQNIANVFFLFLVILVFFPIFGGENPGLSAVPLIFIVTVTAIKDAIEDYRRTALDIELNNAPVHRLRGWDNVNVEEDNISLWRRIKKANSRFFGMIWHTIESLWSKKAREEMARRRAPQASADAPRPSIETHAPRDSYHSPRSARDSFVSAREDIQMTPVPSPQPRQNLDVPKPEDHLRAREMMQRKGDVLNRNLPTKGEARFHKDAWKDLRVGDFVRIYNDDELPADIIVLSTSDPDGACYVETKNLDGETNLKVRQALRCGKSLKHARDCERAQFWIESEPPQPNLYKYNGAIRWHQTFDGDSEPELMTEPMTIDNMLLRGCNLRNTEWALGVVVFTGHDTKIMINSGITPSKRPRIAREMNFNVICNFGILFLLCLLSALINGAAWAKTDASLYFFDFGSIGGSAPMSGFITFFAAIIVFQNLIPIALYITLEIVRLLQAIFIYSDIEMYYEKLDQPCIPKSWNISDDVGQIEYIFSDKTGTLTQNVMEFKKATINGQPYGEAYTEAQAGMQKRLGVDVEKQAAEARAEIADAKIRAVDSLRNLHDNPYLHDDDVTFIAPDYVSDLAGDSGEEQQIANEHFMLCLALCHTVIAEKVPGSPPKMIFKAQSPDEAALVATARDMGFTVLGSTSEGINLNVMGVDRHYPILNTIEFNSSRKRMSAIVRMPDDRILLICKGADSIIYSRLKRGEQQELRKITAEHLEMFAREGLRTLCIAQRELTEDQYQKWQKEYNAAASALENREEKMEEVADQLERDLTLLGGTAIEDRLQDGVPDTIELLGDAGIKLWVLTGDKVETAINIGFSCNLLSNDMELIHLKVEEDETGETPDHHFLGQLEQELDKYLEVFGMKGDDDDLAKAKKNHEPPGPTHGLVIDGFTLKWVLHDALKQKFLLLCKQCRSVLCCRVSPAQKAAVVSMVKHGLNVMTLSIGDGANDVAMIQEADVGVGIAGEEGRQAVMSSDYAIAQFRFLQRLVLVHGRWSYRRLGETVANFFYKNVVWVLGIFWYQIYCDFDVTYIYEYTYILTFNLLFTSVPVVIMGVLDQDVSDKVSLAVPQLYRRGIERLEWTQTKFWMYMLDGVYQSVMVFYIPYLTVVGTSFVTKNGLNIEDRTRLGAYIAHPAVVTINAYTIMNTYRWDWVMILIVVLSDLMIFIVTGIYTATESSMFFYQAAPQIYAQASFWAVFFIVPVICLFPRFAIKAIQKVYFPYDVDIIREQERQGKFSRLTQGDEATVVGEEAASKTPSNSSVSSRKVISALPASLNANMDPEIWDEVAERLNSFVEAIPPGAPQYAFAAIAIALSIWLLQLAKSWNEDKAIVYSVDPPKLPEKHTIVEETNIKVSGTTAIQCYAPATGQFLGFVNPSTPAAIDRSVDAAHAAQAKWKNTSFRERRRVLRSMLRHVLDNQEAICRAACLDSGKTMVDAQLGEILVTVEKLTWTLNHGEKALTPERRPTNLLMAYKRNEVRYEPLGVVGALVSWNYPFHNLIGPIISSIFAGNGVLVKVSEQTAWSSQYFTSIARGALVAHGHDPALIQTVACWPNNADHITSHPKISHITFIGSRPVCLKVAASAAKSLTPVIAELGGKDPSIVLDSAAKDLKRIVEILMRGTFQASGQNCIGIERIIATPKLYEQLVATLAPKVQALRLGPTADVGAMISDASFTRLESLVDNAVRQGARLLAGGKRHVHPEHPKGHYFTPTLLVDVTPDMEIANEECFGPVMTIMRTPGPDAESILSVANAPDFGLGASIFGGDNDPVLRTVVDGLKTGMVAINDFGATYAVQLPFGGVGGSGYGRFAGEEGLRGLCNVKSICADRFGWMGVRTAIPPPVKYPVPDQERSWRFTRGVVGVGYAIGLVGKIKGLLDIMKNA